MINSPKASGYGRKPFSTHRHLESLPWPFFFFAFPWLGEFYRKPPAAASWKRGCSWMWGGCDSSPCLGLGQVEGGAAQKTPG